MPVGDICHHVYAAPDPADAEQARQHLRAHQEALGQCPFSVVKANVVTRGLAEVLYAMAVRLLDKV